MKLKYELENKLKIKCGVSALRVEVKLHQDHCDE